MAQPLSSAPPRPAVPPVVEGVLFERRTRLAAGAEGEVLDLGSLGAPAEAYRPELVRSVTVVEPDPVRADDRAAVASRAGLTLRVVSSLDELSGQTFDTVLSIAALATHADLSTAVATVGRLLAPQGTFSFVEPTMAPGALRSLVTPLTSFVPGVAELHLNRDVPSAVRAQGLTIVAIERFTMPTIIWPLRPFAQATARVIEGADDATRDATHDAGDRP